jgi:hypothetical protein
VKRGEVTHRSEPAAQTLQKVLRGSIGAAAASLIVLSVAGVPRAGFALAAGLVLGSINGHLALRSLRSNASFRIASLGRLGALSALGVGVGFLLGTDVVYLTIAGLAAAQLILAGVAAVEVTRS